MNTDWKMDQPSRKTDYFSAGSLQQFSEASPVNEIVHGWNMTVTE